MNIQKLRVGSLYSTKYSHQIVVYLGAESPNNECPYRFWNIHRNCESWYVYSEVVWNMTELL